MILLRLRKKNIFDVKVCFCGTVGSDEDFVVDDGDSRNKVDLIADLMRSKMRQGSRDYFH